MKAAPMLRSLPSIAMTDGWRRLVIQREASPTQSGHLWPLAWAHAGQGDLHVPLAEGTETISAPAHEHSVFFGLQGGGLATRPGSRLDSASSRRSMRHAISR